MLEKDTAAKTLKEKLEMTSEQMKIMQENFVEMEAQWKKDKPETPVRERTLICNAATTYISTEL